MCYIPANAQWFSMQEFTREPDYMDGKKTI